MASHAMYERASPFFEHVAGGVLDMTGCRCAAADERTTRVDGFAFRRDPVYRIKLEGAGPGGRATRNLFYARLPEVKGTAALMTDEVLRGKPGYE